MAADHGGGARSPARWSSGTSATAPARCGWTSRGANADLAVGCGYKYLNGGPGAPAYLLVAERLQGELTQPLSGWMGHAAPFDFVDDYRPAAGIERFLSRHAADPLDAGAGVRRRPLRGRRPGGSSRPRRSASPTSSSPRVEDRCAGHGLTLVTPRDAGLRGSQASFAHPHAYEIMQALIERGVIGDFRAPDILRCGFTPLYLGYEDVWRAVETLAKGARDGRLARPTLRRPRQGDLRLPDVAGSGAVPFAKSGPLPGGLTRGGGRWREGRWRRDRRR